MESSEDHTVNVLVSTFSGLSLPKTLSIPLQASTPLSEVYETILSKLPKPANTRYILTTPSHNDVSASPNAPLSALLSPANATMLTLRLSIALCGGKGGFGSQLRAAGGRMSKRRKKDGGEDHGSSRNLDGRRLRTITEAKALAEYLAIKPDMDRKTKEERRKRWAEIVEQSERKEDEIRSQGRDGKGRVSEQWLEDKDEAAERTGEAVRRIMRTGAYSDQRFRTGLDKMVIEVDAEDQDKKDDAKEDDDEGNKKDESPGSSSSSGNAPEKARTRQYFGFDDEDDEFMSDEGEDDSNTSVEELSDKGKGKAKAKAIV